MITVWLGSSAAAAAQTVRVTVRLDKEPVLSTKIPPAPPGSATPESWFRDEVIAALNDAERGVKVFHFVATDPAPHELSLRIHPADDFTGWPAAPVKLEMSVLDSSGSVLAVHSLDLLPADKELPSGHWVRNKIGDDVGNFYATVLSKIPIHTAGTIAADRMSVQTALKARLDDESAVFEIKIADPGGSEELVSFVQCNPERVAGFICDRSTIPATGPVCKKGPQYKGAPKSIDAVYLRRVYPRQ